MTGLTALEFDVPDSAHRRAVVPADHGQPL